MDFSETASMCTLVNTYPRLVVLQTLSKGFGLAGIRLGSAFGDPRLIQILNNVKAPYNINKLTAKVALEALNSTDELHRKVAIIKKERLRVIKALRKLPFVRAIYASDSNFILFEVRSCAYLWLCMMSSWDIKMLTLFCLAHNSSPTRCRCTARWPTAAWSFATAATSSCWMTVCAPPWARQLRTTACSSSWRRSRSN